MDNVTRPKLARRRAPDGRLVRDKQPQNRANAQTHKVFVQFGGRSEHLLRGVFDLRSPVGKLWVAQKQVLSQHVGGEPNAVQAELIDMAARLHVLGRICFLELQRTGVFAKTGEVRPALDAFRKCASDERDVLRMLGIERRTKELPTLAEYLASKEDAPAEPSDE